MSNRLALIAVGAGMLASLGFASSSALAQPGPVARPPAPPPECKVFVRYDREIELPGYLLPTAHGAKACVPFTTVAAKPPADYAGDFYVDEFSDAKLRERWAACKADPVCIARVGKPIANRVPPNKEYGLTDPHARYLLGKIDETGEVDLKTIRRPAFFAKAPYHEPIAGDEASTYTVEFTAPAEAYEHIHRKSDQPVKLRGWYVRGAGVDDGHGHKVRALVVMSAGGGGRVTAIDDPSDRLYRVDAKTGRTTLNDYPNATTGSPGQRYWRRHMHMLVQAGFDVLSYDRRGVGVSSGFSDTNTLQQGRDILGAVASLRTGEGLRVLTPKDEVESGAKAAAALRGGAGPSIPVLLFGSSRGTMSSGWAMTLNFDKVCDYDQSVVTCGPPVGDKDIKGAILISEFSSGVGYVSANTSVEDEQRGLGRDRGLFIAGSEVEHNIVFFPSSAILAGVSKWPAAFYARGLWDYADSLEGSIASYDRVKGLKELVVVRGPHPFETWPAEEKARVTERMIVFAKAAVLGKSTVPGGRPWSDMKSLAATASDVWEESNRPASQPGK